MSFVLRLCLQIPLWCSFTLCVFITPIFLRFSSFAFYTVPYTQQPFVDDLKKYSFLHTGARVPFGRPLLLMHVGNLSLPMCTGLGLTVEERSRGILADALSTLAQETTVMIPCVHQVPSRKMATSS